MSCSSRKAARYDAHRASKFTNSSKASFVGEVKTWDKVLVKTWNETCGNDSVVMIV